MPAQKELLTMTIFDIAVLVIAAIAVINGWRRGFIVQAIGLAAILLGLFAAVGTGAEAGAKLGIDPRYATPAGFLIVFIGVTAVLLLLARLLRKLFRVAGLGILDVLLGILLSLLKVGLVLGILCTIFDRLNDGAHFIPQSSLDKSVTYRPLCNIVEACGVWGREAGLQTEKMVEKTLDAI